MDGGGEMNVCNAMRARDTTKDNMLAAGRMGQLGWSYFQGTGNFRNQCGSILKGASCWWQVNGTSSMVGNTLGLFCSHRSDKCSLVVG